MFRLKTENEIVEFEIGECRLSFSQYDGKHVLNFWLHTKFEYKSEDGQMDFTKGPMIEIYMPFNDGLIEGQATELRVPETEEMIDQLDQWFMTGFYNGNHQNLTSSIIRLTKIENNQCEIFFKGKPSEDKDEVSFEGECVLEIADELKRCW